jgi:anti-sigma B factor antagonist
MPPWRERIYCGRVEPIEKFRVSTAELVEGAYVVTVNGEADMYGAPQLSTELDRLITNGARDVIVDLLDVPFVDSTVLGVLLTASKRARVDGHELVLVSDDPRVLRVFEVTGLLGQFTVERSLASAVERSLDRAFVA